MFDKSVNLIEDDEIPYGSADKWIIGVDYGTGNATVFLLGFMSTSETIYICREYYFAGRKEAEEAEDYEAQKTDLEFAEDMKSFIGVNHNITGLSYRDIEIMVDPAANSFKLQLRRFHMKAKNANNEVLDGIRNVATLLKSGKLVIAKSCVNLQKELGTYSWDEKAQLRGEDTPIKNNDHCASKDTYIYTEHGYKKIGDMVGTEGNVYTVDSDGNKCLRRYYNVRKTRKDAEIIRINLESGDYLEVTPDHLILTENRGWVEAQNLTIDDDIVTV